MTVRHAVAGCAVVLAMGWCGSASAAPRTDSATVRGAAPAQATAQTVRGGTAPRVAAGPAFTFSAGRLGPSIRRRVSGSSWRPGCPVALADLRLLRIRYWGFDGRRRVGRMIVAASAVTPMRRAFGDLFRARFPIRRMRLVDDYGASDYASIEADNTSAFNCRRATGSSRFSEHAYGRAVDVNPIENPYVYPDGTTVHAASRPYLDRSRHRPGMA